MISFDAFWAPREERGGEPGEVRGLVYAATPDGGLRVLGTVAIVPARGWDFGRGKVRLARTVRRGHRGWVAVTMAAELPLSSLHSIPAALDFFRDPL